MEPELECEKDILIVHAKHLKIVVQLFKDLFPLNPGPGLNRIRVHLYLNQKYRNIFGPTNDPIIDSYLKFYANQYVLVNPNELYWDLWCRHHHNSLNIIGQFVGRDIVFIFTQYLIGL